MQPWLGQRFEQCGIFCDSKGDGAAVDRRGALERYQVVALLEVEPGVLWNGFTTCFHVEADVLKDYFGNKASSFSVRIRKVFALGDSIQLQARYGKNGKVVPMNMFGRQRCNI